MPSCNGADRGFKICPGLKGRRLILIRPSKKAINSLVASLSGTITQRGKALNQATLIKRLNPQLRGWANYHQAVCASKAFHYIDHIVFELLWKWAKRRHKKKGKWWIAKRYWHSKGNRNWVFSTGNTELREISYMPIIRHTPIRMDANPYLDAEYFAEHKFKQGVKRLSGRFKRVWEKQKGNCYHCGLSMDCSEDKEIFFLKSQESQKGKCDVSDMAYVHQYCQKLYLERRAEA